MSIMPTDHIRLSQVGYAELPYSLQALYRITIWRDSFKDNLFLSLAARVTCQIPYFLLGIVTAIDRCGRLFLVGIGIHTQKIDWVSQLPSVQKLKSGNSIAWFAFCKNLFLREITPPICNISKNDHLDMMNRTVENDRIKNLSHWLELKGKIRGQEREFDLEGAQLGTSMFHSSLRKSLAAFFNLPWISFQNREKRILLDTFSSNRSKQTTSELVKQIQPGQLTVIHSGWNGHAVTFAFCGEYLAIGNGGPRGGIFKHFSRYFSDLHVYKIDPHLVTSSIIHQIKNMRGQIEEKGSKFTYESLPRLLSPTGRSFQDDFCKQFNALSFGQRTGNCFLYSLQAVLPFVWAIAKGSKPTPVQISDAKLEAEFFTHWAALRYANHYRNGEVFNHPEFAKKIAKAKAEKEEKMAKLAFILNHAVLKRFPTFSKMLLSDEVTIISSSMLAMATVCGINPNKIRSNFIAFLAATTFSHVFFLLGKRTMLWQKVPAIPPAKEEVLEA